MVSTELRIKELLRERGWTTKVLSEKTGMSESVPQIKIEAVAKALGVKNIKVVDPETEYEQLTHTIKRFLSKDEVSIIISRRICGLLAQRELKKKKKL